MHRLICAFVVRIGHKQVFSRRGSKYNTAQGANRIENSESIPVDGYQAEENSESIPVDGYQAEENSESFPVDGHWAVLNKSNTKLKTNRKWINNGNRINHNKSTALERSIINYGSGDLNTSATLVCKHVLHVLKCQVIQYERQHDKTNNIIRAPGEDSDQPGHPPSLIWVFAVRTK